MQGRNRDTDVENSFVDTEGEGVSSVSSVISASVLPKDGLVGSPCSSRDSQSLLQHHSSKAAALRHSTFFIVQLSHPYMTTGKTIALTRWTFVGKVMSLLFNILSRLVVTFLPKSKRLLISWLQSPSAVTLDPTPPPKK